MITLADLNRMDSDEATASLLTCCGSSRWASAMESARPFSTIQQVLEHADTHWGAMMRADILEAFSHHPKIGTVENLREKFASTAQWAGSEQSGVQAASESTLTALAQGNEDYEKRFGYIFIVCATGKSAQDMLSLLETRIGNDLEAELSIAAAEQAKITRLRLEKLLENDE